MFFCFVFLIKKKKVRRICFLGHDLMRNKISFWNSQKERQTETNKLGDLLWYDLQVTQIIVEHVGEDGVAEEQHIDLETLTAAGQTLITQPDGTIAIVPITQVILHRFYERRRVHPVTFIWQNQLGRIK